MQHLEDNTLLVMTSYAVPYVGCVGVVPYLFECMYCNNVTYESAAAARIRP